MKLQTLAELSKHYGSFVNYELLRAYYALPSRSTGNIENHITAAVQWICRAQDAFQDGGVARSYSIVYHPYFRRRGWISSYPETTGYIIPTFFDVAKKFGRKDIAERAVRMADWECCVQLDNGAVQGGTIGEPPTPAIFNTGQVMFGWIRAFRETRKSDYLDCAVKAGKFLLAQQDQDGAWRKALSNYASSRMTFYTYNTRTAWALMELALLIGDQAFHNAAIRNIEFAIGQQLENGWFKSNCLNDPAQPLLHTVAYCIRGILETGVLTKDSRYIERAAMAADALLPQQRPDGSLAGRFNERWEPAVSWRCLTGEAQIAGIWGRLYQITGKSEYLDGLRATNAALRKVQFLHSDHPGLHGGIGGAQPLHGQYGSFEILNWAVKFFIDAQMLEHAITENNRSLN
jgi:Squalene-hopene cyclase C-terminal domain